jgi:hypothetical protein
MRRQKKRGIRVVICGRNLGFSEKEMKRNAPGRRDGRRKKKAKKKTEIKQATI